MKLPTELGLQTMFASRWTLGAALVAALLFTATAAAPRAVAQQNNGKQQQKSSKAKAAKVKAAAKAKSDKTTKDKAAQDEAGKKTKKQSSPGKNKPKKRSESGKQGKSAEGAGTTGGPHLGLLIAPTPSGSPLVVGVRRGSPAEQAGIEQGDFIVSLDGKKVTSPEQLTEKLSGMKPNATTKVTIWRNGEQSTHQVRFGEQTEGRAWLGAMIRRNLEGGVEVARVYLGSPAEQAGLEAGDRIVAVNGKDVSSPQDVVELLQGTHPGEKVKLRIARGDEQQTVQVEMGSLANLHERLFGKQFRTGADGFDGMADPDFDGIPDRVPLFRAPAGNGRQLRDTLREMLRQRRSGGQGGQPSASDSSSRSEN